MGCASQLHQSFLHLTKQPFLDTGILQPCGNSNSALPSSIMLVPCIPDTPAYKYETKAKGRTCYHMLPCVPRLRTHLPTGEGSGATTCPMAPDPASLLGRALAPPCVPRLRTPPPCSEGSDAATCLTALDPASLLERAPTLPRDPRLTEGHGPQE
jgi:hypothetical protein